MKLYDTKTVARFLDLTERRVRQLRDEKIITEYRPGLYDLAPTVNAYINYLRGQNPNNDEAINYNTERAKLTRVKRESEELDLALRKKELHLADDIESLMTDMLINFKSRLMSIPSKLSPILAKKTDKTEIFKIIKASIDDALNELADYNTLFGREEEDAAAHEEINGEGTS